MTNFTISGPYRVPLYKGAAGRMVRAQEGTSFFTTYPAMANHVGCYVFGIRAGGGIMPVYVGKTTNRFDQECFQPTKLGKYNECLTDYQKGTPVMFFVLHPVQSGPNNNTQIGKLEKFLIQLACVRNPKLLNVQGTASEDWAITGVIRNRPGHPSASARLFKSMLHMNR